MAKSTNYFTVEQLVTLCEKLNLETEGSKSELIRQLLDYESPSRVSFHRARVIPLSTINQSIQTPESLNLNANQCSKIEKYYNWFVKIAIWIGFFGGVYAFMQLFVENVPVKRSWF